MNSTVGDLHQFRSLQSCTVENSRARVLVQGVSSANTSGQRGQRVAVQKVEAAAVEAAPAPVEEVPEEAPAEVATPKKKKKSKGKKEAAAPKRTPMTQDEADFQFAQRLANVSAVVLV